MTVPVKHKHSEQHRGMVPDDQLATGTPVLGDTIIHDGAGGRAWGPGGGDCAHEHVRERFVAAGDSPETFALASTPTGVTSVFRGAPSPLSLVDPDEVTITGSDVALNTDPDDVIVILYERACEPPATGGVVADSDPGTDGYSWYDLGETWPPTVGVWTANTYYQPGSFIEDSNGHTQARFPNLPGMSDSSEPTWATDGTATIDLDGKWSDLGIAPDFDALAETWAATTQRSDPSVDRVILTTPLTTNGHHYVGADNGFETQLTGSAEPVWPTDPCGGTDTMTAPQGGYYTDPYAITARPYVTGSLALDIDGTPLTPTFDFTEIDPAVGSINVSAASGAGDILTIVYTPDCP